MNQCPECYAVVNHTDWCSRNPKRGPSPVLRESAGSARDMPKASEFYLGVEWLGAWLVDHVEGGTVTEELVVEWCSQAWAKHILRQNEQDEPQERSER